MTHPYEPDGYDYAQLREKFLTIARKQGMHAAISALHNEIGVLEARIYEGGFDKERLAVVQRLRELSRDIWSTQFIENGEK
ncbi:MAG: hypothetical protein HYW49_05370 [Deltaproteobacteria bacterium]|nr:hypothetical protein [Deltaproteobacteria bacterium]